MSSSANGRRSAAAAPEAAIIDTTNEPTLSLRSM
jgi:hypothetical protein